MATKRGIGKLTRKQQEALGKIRGILLHHRHRIMNGTLVAFDPSCISRTGSKPAYAIYVRGEFVERGILDIAYKPSLAWRLQSLRDVIQRDIAPHVDVCVIEETPVQAIRTRRQASDSGKTYMNLRSIASLKKACGAIMAAFPVGTPVIEMPAHLWQQVARNQNIEITKEDDADAQLIGYAAVYLVSEINHMVGDNNGEGESEDE